MSRDADASRPWAAKADRPIRPLARLAKVNRGKPTDAERKLWRLLRDLPLGATHFRRQVVIGDCIADFACRSAKLVIEVDGGQHCENADDDIRTAKLQALGWRVLRFWNNDVLLNPSGVAESVMAALSFDASALSGTTPTPGPSPQGGGEKSGAFSGLGEVRL